MTSCISNISNIDYLQIPVYEDAVPSLNSPSAPLCNGLSSRNWNPSTETIACNRTQSPTSGYIVYLSSKIFTWSYPELFRTKMSTLVEKLTAEGDGDSAGE